MVRGRALRVAEAIKEEVSEILLNELKDPRIGFTSVTAVEVSDDLRHARIFFSVFAPPADQEKAMEALEGAKGFIRSELSKRLRLRVAPELAFQMDRSIERGDRISRLLAEARRSGGFGSLDGPHGGSGDGGADYDAEDTKKE